MGAWAELISRILAAVALMTSPTPEPTPEPPPPAPVIVQVAPTSTPAPRATSTPSPRPPAAPQAAPAAPTSPPPPPGPPAAATALVADLQAGRANHAAWLRTDGRGNPYGQDPAVFLQLERNTVALYDQRIAVVRAMGAGDCSSAAWLVADFREHQAMHRSLAAQWSGAAAAEQVGFANHYDWRIGKAKELCP